MRHLRPQLGRARAALVALLASGCCLSPSGGSATAPGPVTFLGPGFAPDPLVLTGAAGGPTPAPSLDTRCSGFVSTAASHTLEVTAPIPFLRVAAHVDVADGDPTLVVRLADGTYVCNDDGDGLDPIVDLTDLPAGRHQVFVGIRSETTTAPHRLGLSSSTTFQPSSL